MAYKQPRLGIGGGLLLLSLGFSFAGRSYWVNYGWQLFQNAGDARSLSLGNAQVAGGEGSVAPLWNPANQLKSLAYPFTYAHQSRFAGTVNSDLVAFPLRMNSTVPMTFVLLYEGVNDIPDSRQALLDLNGNGILDAGERLDWDKITSFQQVQYGVHLSTAWTLHSFLVGVGVKGMFHSLGEHYGSGLGLDLGALVHPWKGGKVGVTLSDITTSWIVWENGTVERTLPRMITGISQRLAIPRTMITLTAEVDYLLAFGKKVPGVDFTVGGINGRYRMGVDLRYGDRLSVRLGRNSNGYLTTGIGFLWSHIALYYAYQPTPADIGLGSTHFISVSLEPQWLINRLPLSK